MLRSARRCAGNYSRPTAAQQHQQQHQTTSQHASGSFVPLGRSTSVLASLLRMRSQFLRLRSSQQQQVIGVVLARRGKTRLLGSKDPVLTTAAVKSAGGDGEEAEGDSDPQDAARGDATTSSSSSGVLQAGVLLCTDAQRLLRSESRRQDPLSDVARSSPQYPAEAGKFLTAAAVFGAATTFPRVEEVCAWLRANTDALTTTRQIMSLCTPLMNLTDGSTAGVAFVLEVLYEPLLFALQDVGRGGDGGANAATSAVRDGAGSSCVGSGGVTSEQQMIALTSCCAMVTKWATEACERQRGPAASADTPDSAVAAAAADMQSMLRHGDCAKMLRITEGTVAAIVRFTTAHPAAAAAAGGAVGGRTHEAVWATLQGITGSDVVQWLRCLHGMEGVISLSSMSPEEKEAALRRLGLCHRVLLPLVQQTLERDCGAAATATTTTTATTADEAAAATGAAASSSSSSSGLRVQDVADLVQIGLFPSVEASHTGVALRCGLSVLPRTLAAASVRELCFMTQVVGKVRGNQPAAVTAPLLRSLVAALRPRLFLLYGANAYQLRAAECSLLLSQLSRWEEVPGVTISDDVVQLLCQRFGEQMSTAHAPQLVPFLQGLARLEERHRHSGNAAADGKGAELPVHAQESADKNTDGLTPATEAARLRHRRRRSKRAVRYHYSTTARVLQQCAQRTAALASGAHQQQQHSKASAVSVDSGAKKSTGSGAETTLRLSPAEAAQLIGSFVQLSSPLVEEVFGAVEPLLGTDIVTAAAAGDSGEAAVSLPVSTADLNTRVAVQEAVIRFLTFATQRRASASLPQTHKTASAAPHSGIGSAGDAVQRANALLTQMEHSLTAVVQQAVRPRDVVAVWPLVRHRLLHQRAVTSPEEVEEDAVSPPPSPAASPSPPSPRSRSSSSSWSRAEVRLASRFAERVCFVAHECNGPALGSLAVAITSLTTAGALPMGMAHAAMEAVWRRCVEGLEAAAAMDEEGEEGAERGECGGTSSSSCSPSLLRRTVPLALNLDSCKKVMDAARSTMTATPAAQRSTTGPPPPIFLHHVATLCTSLAATMATQDASATAVDGAEAVSRGTHRAYTAALADLRRHTMFGRSLVSFCAASLSPSASTGGVSSVDEVRFEAWCTAAAAYVDVVRAAMDRYATEAALSESWCGVAAAATTTATAASDDTADAHTAAPPVPLELLSTTSRVVTQLQRFAHRGGGPAAAHRAEAEGQEEAEEGERGDVSVSEGGVESGPEEFSGTTAVPVVAMLDGVEPLGDEETAAGAVVGAARTALDAAVLDVLGMVGDTIALLAKQERQASVDDEWDESVEGEESVTSQEDADHSGNTPESSSSPASPAPAAMNPKHLLILLQSFELAKYRHAEMLYGILPELRGCAAQLDPLQLSLLIRALAQLGAWNNRLLRVLAAAVETKVQTCGLRQCHSLLRDLCRSGCVSANTYVEVRGSTYTDWTRVGPRRHGAGDTQEPLQRLAEAVLWRLDALVCTRATFFQVAKTAALADMVGVVTALRFFEVPPPPTYDAFVVLAIHRLAATHRRLSPMTAVQHAIVLLDAATRLRQPAQQCASVRTVWTVVWQVVMQTSCRTGTAADGAASVELPLRMCGQLWQLACQHSLRYGKATTEALFRVSAVNGETDQASTLLYRLQYRLLRAAEAYAWGPNPRKDVPPSSHLSGSAATADALRPLPPSGQAALRHYGARAAPSVVRGSRDLAEHLSHPLRLARRIVEAQDVSHVATPSSPLTAPMRQEKEYVRVAACLLRSDVWESESVSVETQLMLVAALQRLWDAADLHALLRTSPESFSTEELVVAVAVAGHLLQAGAADDAAGRLDATRYRDACASALRHLCAEATEWRLPAAVDAWVLLVRVAAPPAAPQLRLTELGEVEGVCTVLAQSGAAVLAAFLQLQSVSACSVTRARLFAEVLRLVQASGPGCLLSFAAESSSAVEAAAMETSGEAAPHGDEILFREQYAEVQRCILAALTASPEK